MAATNQQMSELSVGATFQKKVAASIMKKALAIAEDVRLNGNVNFSAPQNTRAHSLAQGQSLEPYYLLLACSTNVIASNISVVNGETLTDITDAGLDSQVYTTVFQDLV
jgi:hypothetical protein